MEVPDFEAYLEATSARVDAALEAHLRREDGIPNLHDGVLYALGLDLPDRRRRGKRLRPVLCLLACESLGGDLQQALPFALACETLHNFMLVHDDIEDEDRTRRGRDSAWVRFGRDHAINIGDYMFAQTYGLVTLSRDRGVSPERVLRLVDLVTHTVERTGEGQALDMIARRRRDLTAEDYLRIVRAKTGYYLAAPLVGGAIVSRAPEDVVQALFALGDQIGPIFQIADDLLDLSEAKGRSEPGSDVKEGKRSYLVVHGASRCTAAEREELFRILDAPRDATTPEEVQWVLALFDRYGTVAAARAAGEALLEEARTTLAGLPSPLGGNLEAAVEFMLGRTW